MLHTKCQGHRSFGSGEEDFYGFYHIWACQPPWSSEQDHLNKLPFPHSKEAPVVSEEKMFENARAHTPTPTPTPTPTHTTTEAYLSYKLTTEPKGSSELKTLY